MLGQLRRGRGGGARGLAGAGGLQPGACRCGAARAGRGAPSARRPRRGRGGVPAAHASSVRIRSPGWRCSSSRRAIWTSRTSSIRRSLEGAAFDRFARARMLPAQAEIARAAGDDADGPGRARRASRDRRSDRIAGDQGGQRVGRRHAPHCSRTTTVARSRHLARGTEAMERGGRAPTNRRTWRSRSPRQRSQRGTTRTTPRPSSTARGSRSNGWGRNETRGETRSCRARNGSDAGIARPGSSRTFLFTDIVGSTALIGVIGDEAWDDLRRWHDQTLRSLVRRSRAARRSTMPATGSSSRSPTPTRRRLRGRDPATARRASARPRVRAAGAHGPARDRRATRTGAATRASACTRHRGSARWPGPGEILASAETIGGVPDARTSERRHASAERDRRAGRRGLDRVAPSASD